MTYHYMAGSSWAERAKLMAEDMADMREHRGFAALLDLVEGEWRALVQQVMDPELDDEKVKWLRTKAMAWQDVLVELKAISSKEELTRLQESVMKGFTADEEVLAEYAEAQDQAGRNTY